MLNLTERITNTLDRLETQLPPPSGSVLRFNRSIVSFGADQACKVREAVSESMRSFFGVTRDAGKSVADESAAASIRIVDTADRELNRLSDDLTPHLGRGTRYEDWTRADLYERASELDIPGRSGMTKRQLISALRAH